MYQSDRILYQPLRWAFPDISMIYADTDSAMFYIPNRLWPLDIKMESISKLNEWKIEHGRLSDCLSIAGLPNVLLDLTIEYVGSPYIDPLILIGSDQDFIHQIHLANGYPNKRTLRATRKIIKKLETVTGIRPTKMCSPEKINAMISNIRKYELNPMYEVGMKQFAIEYRILLMYFI